MSFSRTFGGNAWKCVYLSLSVACSNNHRANSSDAAHAKSTTGGAAMVNGGATSVGGTTMVSGGTLNGTSASGGTATFHSTTQPSAGSPGCSSSGKPKGDLHLSIKDGRGTARDIEVIVPASYTPPAALAVVFVFHGLGGTQDDAKALGLQSVPSAAAGALFVFPQGVQYKSWGVGWDDSCDGYDVALFDNVVAQLEADYCVDPNRVFVSGFSWGCDFVTALTCCRGDRIRAVGAASCSDGFSNTADYKSYQNFPCPVSPKAAIRFTHDVTDDGAYTAAHFAVTSKLYQVLEGCSGGSSPTTPSPCIKFQNCAHDYVECAYAGLGHAIPSNWATETWNFFSSAR